MAASLADMIANPGDRRVNFLRRDYVGNVEGEAKDLRFWIADFRLALLRPVKCRTPSRPPPNVGKRVMPDTTLARHLGEVSRSDGGGCG